MTHRPIAGSALGRPDHVAITVVVQELLVENALSSAAPDSLDQQLSSPPARAAIICRDYPIRVIRSPLARPILLR